MGRIKKCIVMLLTWAVVLSVVQIPAFAADTIYLKQTNLGKNQWTNDEQNNNGLNCWFSSEAQPNGGASWWTGGDRTMLGGQKTKVWKSFASNIAKGSKFIVECAIKGTNGGEYVLGLTADKVKTVEDGDTLFEYPVRSLDNDKKGLCEKVPGALVGREVKDGKDVLKANTESHNFLNAPLTEAGGTTEAASPNDGDWHFYKIYCDGSKYADVEGVLAADVTVTIDGKVYNTNKIQMNEATAWKGIFFMNNTKDTKEETDEEGNPKTVITSTKTKLAEFKMVKVYTPEKDANFNPPTSNTLDKSDGNTYYKNNGQLHQWIWNNDGSYNNILNCWYNTSGYSKNEDGTVKSGPGAGNASFWTGNNTTMLGGQKTKVWKYFEKGAKIDKNTSFIVECEMRGFGGGEYVMGLTSDNVRAGDTTYNSVSSLGENLTGALIGREVKDGKDVLKVNTDSNVGLNKDLFDTNGVEANAPADVTDYTDNTKGWHKYKIYCDASKYPDNLYMDVTVTDVTDPNNTIVYQKNERVGTNTDGSWNGIFFMNNSTNATNTKLAEFKSIKVYVPDKFIAPNTFSGSAAIKSGDSAVGDNVAAGTSVKAEADIINTAAKTGKAYLILAEYNSDDRVTAVKVKEIGLNNSETQTGSTEDIALSGIPGGYVRAFLWTDKFQPICRADKADITAAETVTE